MTTTHSRADALTGQHVHAVMMAQTASCTCLTKTPDPQYHDATCRYRLLAEVIDFIEHRSSQPAAAPIGARALSENELSAILSASLNSYMTTAERDCLRNLMRRVKADKPIVQPAPSPADERAVFDSEVGSVIADAATRGIAWMAFKAGSAYARAASANETGADVSGAYTYSSVQATNCARCGNYKHTPLRIDWMGGYVCLTCIDRELESRSPAMAAEAVAIPAGYALVPIEPTSEMVERICGTSTASKWPDDFSEQSIRLRRELARKAWKNALSAVNLIASLPVGWKSVLVNEHFADLIEALEYADDKGYLPDAMRASWESFEYDENIAAPQPAQADARVGLTEALRRAREELSIVEWENDPPSRVVKLFDEIDALLAAHPGTGD